MFQKESSFSVEIQSCLQLAGLKVKQVGFMCFTSAVHSLVPSVYFLGKKTWKLRFSDKVVLQKENYKRNFYYQGYKSGPIKKSEIIQEVFLKILIYDKIMLNVLQG